MKGLNTMAKRYMNRVQYWDTDEPDTIIVTLHYGYSFEHCCHEGVKGFDTAKEAREAIKNSWPCNCDQCKKKQSST
jgi:hypothetical protein